MRFTVKGKKRIALTVPSKVGPSIILLLKTRMGSEILISAGVTHLRHQCRVVVAIAKPYSFAKADIQKRLWSAPSQSNKQE